MTEFFITARSFAAPFFSDESTRYIEAETPRDALLKFKDEYKHPAGLYAAEVWESADAYHKGEMGLARWLSNHALAKQQAMVGASSFYGRRPGEFEVDGKLVTVENPMDGNVWAWDKATHGD